MNEYERMEEAKKWDPRTPLERFDSLSPQEQSAFLAFFARSRCILQGSWSPDRGLSHVSFGKAECEWVGLDFWRYKLPGLRLTNYQEGPRRPALGMTPGSVVWEIYIQPLDDGYAAREAFWARRQGDDN